HFAFADELLRFAESEMAVLILAVGNHDERFLSLRAALRERNRFGDRVVKRRAAARLRGAERAAHRGAILSPALNQLRLAVEPVKKHLIVLAEQIEQEL